MFLDGKITGNFNISVVASGKIPGKNTTVNPQINAPGVYLIFKKFRKRLLEGGVSKRKMFISNYRRNSIIFNQQIQIHHLHLRREGLIQYSLPRYPILLDHQRGLFPAPYHRLFGFC